MKRYLDLFTTFFMIGLISFGGGYAMIPVIQQQMEKHQWLDAGQFSEVITIAASAPGPIAANVASVTGFRLLNLSGAFVACVGVILPSFILIILLAKNFSKFNESVMVQSVMRGLRPTMTGIIAFSAVKLAAGGGAFGGSLADTLKNCIIIGAAFLLLEKTKIHPLWLLLASGVISLVWLLAVP